MATCRYHETLSTTALHRGTISRAANEHVTHGIGRFPMKLRSMSAEVRNVPNVKIEDCHGEVHELGLCRELTSYDSVVAYYCMKTGIVYLLTSYGYSVTTWKHVHAFVQDYCDGTPDWDAKRIRQDMSFYAKNPNYGATYVPCRSACTHGNFWFKW